MRDTLLGLLLLFASVGVKAVAADSENFYLDENGVTIRCENAVVGEAGMVNGTLYVAVDNAALKGGGESNYSQLCTSHVTRMNALFQNNRTFNQDIGSWDTRNVTDMTSMFQWATSFNRDLRYWDVRQVTSMVDMFAAAFSFNQNIGKWNTVSADNMDRMFSNALAFDQDLSGWDVKRIPVKPYGFDARAGFEGQSDRQPRWGTSPFYLDENGVTVRCENARYLDEGYVYGKKYIAVNDQHLKEVHDRYIRERANGDRSYQVDFTQYCTSNVTDMSNAFADIDDFDQAIGSWDTRNVTTMYKMFDNTPFNQAIGSWATGNVLDMGFMFHQAGRFNQDIGDWNTSRVTGMAVMFGLAGAFNQDLGRWNTSNVTNMDNMFSGAAAFDQDLGRWCVAKIAGKPHAFDNAAGFEGKSDRQPRWGYCPKVYLDENGVTVRCEDALPGNWYRLYGTGKNYFVPTNQHLQAVRENYLNGGNQVDYTEYCTSHVTDMSNVFNQIDYFNQDIGNWDTSHVVSMRGMFSHSPFNRDLKFWDTSVVTDMAGMFGYTPFNQNISLWNVANVVEMTYMFRGASAFDQDISGWCVSSIPEKPVGFDTQSGFEGDDARQPYWGRCSLSKFYRDENGVTVRCEGAEPMEWGRLENKPYLAVTNAYLREVRGDYLRDGTTTDYSAFCTTHVTDMSSVFSDLDYFNQDISSWDTARVTDMSSMFSNTPFNGEMRRWDTGSVTAMGRMFQNAANFNRDIGNWNTSGVTDMGGMFENAAAFNRDIGHWETSNVTTMATMFSGAAAFDQDISRWCVKKIAAKPSGFDLNAGFEGEGTQQPQWGSCSSLWTRTGQAVAYSFGGFDILADQTLEQDGVKHYRNDKGVEVRVRGGTKPILVFRYKDNPESQCMRGVGIAVKKDANGDTVFSPSSADFLDPSCTSLDIASIQRNGQEEAKDIEIRPFDTSWKFYPDKKEKQLVYAVYPLHPFLKGIAETTQGFIYVVPLNPDNYLDVGTPYNIGINVGKDQVAFNQLYTGVNLGQIFNIGGTIPVPFLPQESGPIVLSQDYSHSRGQYVFGLDKLLDFDTKALKAQKSYDAIIDPDNYNWGQNAPNPKESAEAVVKQEGGVQSMQQLGGILTNALKTTSVTFSPVRKDLELDFTIRDTLIFKDLKTHLGFGVRFVNSAIYPNYFKVDSRLIPEWTHGMSQWMVASWGVGVGLSSINLEVRNLADALYRNGDNGQWPKGLKIKMGAGMALVDAGTMLALKKATKHWPLELTGTLTLDFREYLGIHLKGNASLFGALNRSGAIEFRPPQPYVSVEHRLDFLGIVYGEAKLTASYDAGYQKLWLKGYSQGGLQLPGWAPILPNHRVADIRGEFENEISASKYEVMIGFNVKVIANHYVKFSVVRVENGQYFPPKLVKIDDVWLASGGDGETYSSVERLGEGDVGGFVTATSAQENSYTVTGENDYLIYAVDCESALPELQVVGPDQTLYPNAATLTFTSVEEALAHPDLETSDVMYDETGYSRTMLLRHPEAGTYAFRILNPEETAECRFQIAQSDEAPNGTFDFIPALETALPATPQKIPVSVNIDDPEQSAVRVGLYLIRPKDGIDPLVEENLFDPFESEQDVRAMRELFGAGEAEVSKPVFGGNYEIEEAYLRSRSMHPVSAVTDKYADLDVTYPDALPIAYPKVHGMDLDAMEMIPVSGDVDTNASKVTLEMALEPGALKPGSYTLVAKLYDYANAPVYVEYPTPVVLTSRYAQGQSATVTSTLEQVQTGAHVSWTDPKDGNMTLACIYLYEENDVGGGARYLFTRPIAEEGYDLPGLSANKQYTATVSFLDSQGYETPESEPMAFSTDRGWYKGYSDVVVIVSDSRLQLEADGKVQGRIRLYNRGTAALESGTLRLYYDKIDDAKLFADVQLEAPDSNTYIDIEITLPPKMRELYAMEDNRTEVPNVLVTIENKVPEDIEPVNDVETIHIDDPDFDGLRQSQGSDVVIWSIPAGYSLIALPVEQSGITAESIGNGVELFTLDAAGAWQRFEGELEPGKGYWAHAPQAAAVSLHGMPYIHNDADEVHHQQSVLGVGYDSPTQYLRGYYDCDTLRTFDPVEQVWVDDAESIEAGTGFICHRK